MDKKVLGVPLAIVVLAAVTAIFVSIPLFLAFNVLNTKLDRISTGVYVIESTQRPILATPSASPAQKEASQSGKAR